MDRSGSARARSAPCKLTANRPLPRTLGYESLERREVMAGNVVAVLTEGTLTILGDAADNGINIRYDANTKKHIVSGTDCGGEPTLINDLAEDAAFSGVRSIIVRAGAGNDRLDFGAVDHLFTRVDKKLTIMMGDGDDTVELGRRDTAIPMMAPSARGCTSARESTSTWEAATTRLTSPI
jgi:Ca2+-binding RTX toxin-like protein